MGHMEYWDLLGNTLESVARRTTTEGKDRQAKAFKFDVWDATSKYVRLNIYTFFNWQKDFVEYI